MSPPKIKPLVSAQTEPSTETQFKHFGVLNNGQQGRGSIFTSVTVNILIAAIICLLGAAAKKTIDKQRLELTYVPTEQPKPLPKPKPPVIKPPKIPPPSEVKMDPPKIRLPELAKLPEPPKMPEIKMAPVAVNLPPAPPKIVTAPAAPKAVNLSAKPQAAAIANNQVASPIRLGQMDNPIKNNSGPAVSKINLGQAGAAGMPASNTGLGAVSKVNLGGNGQPAGGTTGTGVRAVQGVTLGVQGGTGPLNSTGRAAAVNLAAAPPPSAVRTPASESAPRGNPPKILVQPKPVYTAEATAKHIEGIISVRVRFTTSGGVQVLGVANDLGFGLGQSAMHAVQGIRFQPATDAAGRPVDWEGIVKVTFQIAG